MLADCYRALGPARQGGGALGGAAGRFAAAPRWWPRAASCTPAPWPTRVASRTPSACSSASKPPAKRRRPTTCASPTPWPTCTSGPATCPRPASSSRSVAARRSGARRRRAPALRCAAVAALTRAVAGPAPPGGACGACTVTPVGATVGAFPLHVRSPHRRRHPCPHTSVPAAGPTSSILVGDAQPRRPRCARCPRATGVLALELTVRPTEGPPSPCRWPGSTPPRAATLGGRRGGGRHRPGAPAVLPCRRRHRRAAPRWWPPWSSPRAGRRRPARRCSGLDGVAARL